MPFIPDLPGVPPLSSFAPTNLFTVLAGDAISALLGFLLPQWGIFLDGIPVLAYDSQISFEFRQDFPISTYPVEQSSFQSYDKVQLPSEIRVRLSAGGSVFNRQAFLATIDAAISTTLLYDVVTPEKVFLNYNFTHRDLVRTADQGVGLIVVDLWLTEVIETATALFQTTQLPGQAGQFGSGYASPTPPSTSVSQSVSGFGVT